MLNSIPDVRPNGLGGKPSLNTALWLKLTAAAYKEFSNIVNIIAKST